jgi:hypothetical protein
MTGFVSALHTQGGVLASDGSEGGCFERACFDCVNHACSFFNTQKRETRFPVPRTGLASVYFSNRIHFAC